MSQASTTTLGEIKLSGDISGSNDANFPELTHIVGLTAGSYILPHMTVDAKGRVTSITDSSTDEIISILPYASASNFGLVKIGANISVLNGTISIPDADSSTFGVMKTGIGLRSVNGVVSVDADNLHHASSTEYGVVKTGNSITNVDGLISANISQIQSQFTSASTVSKGLIKVGTGLSVASGVLSVNTSTISYPTSSLSQFGLVKIGSGLEVDGSGKLNVVFTPSSSSTAGYIKIANADSGIFVAGDGTISVKTASSTELGGVKPNTSHFTIAGDGTISVNSSFIASSSTPGLIKVGTGLVSSNGVVSIDTSSLPKASDSALGCIIVGSGLQIDGAGVLSVKKATSTTLGGVIVNPGQGLGINGDGSIFIDPTQFPVASTNSFGIVEIGANISVSGGVISVPVASSSVLGLIKVGSGLSIDGSGVLSPDLATNSVPGIVKIGSNINVDGSGVISINTSSDTVKGVVQIGTGLTISNGIVSFNTADQTKWASNTTPGVVQIGSGLSIDTSGKLYSSYAVTDINYFDFNQYLPVKTFQQSTGVVTINPENYSAFIFNMRDSGGSLTVNNNTSAGYVYFSMQFIQGFSSAVNVTLSSNFKFMNGSGLTSTNAVSTTLGSLTIIECVLAPQITSSISVISVTYY